ncbi:MAG: GTPase Era [Nitrospirota bacterium]
MTNGFRSGYVSIIGRPNAGKSTLLNSILGEKISIVTSRPQTTRRKITGILTSGAYQIVFVDTPGIHKPRHLLGRLMVKEATAALKHTDIILLMVLPHMPDHQDKALIDLLKKIPKKPQVYLVINKIDLIKKAEVLPLIDEYNKLYRFDAIIPISALNSEDVVLVTDKIAKSLPCGPKYYPDDMVTDQTEKQLVSDIIREQLMEATQEEVPHSIAVEVLTWSEREDGLISISCNIYVERAGQKGIIIGKGGQRLKAVAAYAREEIEKMLGRKVFMELWVKVKEGWRTDERALKEMGFK